MVQHCFALSARHRRQLHRTTWHSKTAGRQGETSTSAHALCINPSSLTLSTPSPVLAMPQSAKAAREQQAAVADFQQRQQEADKAQRGWERRQAALRKAIPDQLWGRANATWGSPLLPWEIGAFGQLVSASAP